MLSRRSWRSVELTSLELVSEEELSKLANAAGLQLSKYLDETLLYEVHKAGNGAF